MLTIIVYYFCDSTFLVTSTLWREVGTACPTKIESQQRSNIPVDHSRVCGKTYVISWRPFQKSCLHQELKLMGEYALQNKCKIWRAKFALMEIHKAAQELLVMGQEPRHLFEGNALLQQILVSC
ncbi:small ribosomal subunit protein uS4-like [Marmota flaviventris]|uniref:small ribosomal subunit protein uS4-like n=1 Tax=Marmota flaviventris TaxID=93162 RepID=UPI000FFFB984|nr:40S ribosomal protein S9-like [Marmota flaviventris]